MQRQIYTTYYFFRKTVQIQSYTLQRVPVLPHSKWPVLPRHKRSHYFVFFMYLKLLYLPFLIHVAGELSNEDLRYRETFKLYFFRTKILKLDPAEIRSLKSSASKKFVLILNLTFYTLKFHRVFRIEINMLYILPVQHICLNFEDFV